MKLFWKKFWTIFFVINFCVFLISIVLQPLEVYVKVIWTLFMILTLWATLKIIWRWI